MVLYYNGTIITMRGETPEIKEAVLTDGGKILFAGTMAEAERTEGFCADRVTKRDLNGAVMLPAFLDPHSHITAVAQTFGYAALAEVKSFEELVQCLSAYKDSSSVGPGEWIVGVGYDHNFLKEKRHPDKTLLDRAFPDNPVMISHASGHMGVVNSKALALLSITAETKNPEGGVIGRMAAAGNDSCKGTEPNGYLEETAFTRAGSIIPEPEKEQTVRQFLQAQELYLSGGIATIQDGMTGKKEWSMLKYMAEHHLLSADVAAYADMKSDKELLNENPDYTEGYRDHLRIGGYKIFLDGSPQGRTAWMSRPYENNGAGEDSGYCGYPVYKDSETEQFFETAFRENRQILAHCNGDAAAEQMINACEKAKRATGCDLSKIRPVMIHAQLVREDQLKRMADLFMTASFFTAHTWYWGDIHLKNFGRDRAVKISPAKTALKEHVNVTLHQDSPVIKPDMLETIWCAVNRRSRSGVLMGEEEKLTPYEALKAVTESAAYQYGEEARKGSIEPGKQADFVILDKDPLNVPSEEIKEIKVLETIKDGVTLYRAERA